MVRSMQQLVDCKILEIWPHVDKHAWVATRQNEPTYLATLKMRPDEGTFPQRKPHSDRTVGKYTSSSTNMVGLKASHCRSTYFHAKRSMSHILPCSFFWCGQLRVCLSAMLPQSDSDVFFLQRPHPRWFHRVSRETVGSKSAADRPTPLYALAAAFATSVSSLL